MNLGKMKTYYTQYYGNHMNVIVIVKEENHPAWDCIKQPCLLTSYTSLLEKAGIDHEVEFCDEDYLSTDYPDITFNLGFN